MQANGVGTELLRRTLQHADDAGAKQRALITFAFNTVSQGLYIRHGFAPRFVVYFMNTPRKALTQNVNAQRLEVSVLNASEAQLSAMAGVDRLALGFTRGKHHALKYSHSFRRWLEVAEPVTLSDRQRSPPV